MLAHAPRQVSVSLILGVLPEKDTLMATTNEITRERWSTVGWWSLWAGAFIVSLLPPVVYHWRRIAEIVEPLRYQLTHFLPAELLLLRHMGEWSHWIPAALLLLLVLGIYRPRFRNRSIVAGVLLTAIFSSIYAAYCLIVVSMYLVGYTQVLQKNQEAEQAAAPNRSATPNLKSESSVRGSEG